METYVTKYEGSVQSMRDEIKFAKITKTREEQSTKYFVYKMLYLNLCIWCYIEPMRSILSKLGLYIVYLWISMDHCLIVSGIIHGFHLEAEFAGLKYHFKSIPTIEQLRREVLTV